MARIGNRKAETLRRKLVDPLHDLRMELYQAGKYYYYPGWHEPGTYLESKFNKKAHDSLLKDLTKIIDAEFMQLEQWTLAQFNAQNGAALQTLINKYHINFVKFLGDVLDRLRKLSSEVVAEETIKDEIATKINDSFQKFIKVVGTWGKPYSKRCDG